MSKSKITVRAISNLPPQEKVYEIRDGDGFGLRVYPSGKKCFFFSYTIKGKRRQTSIGDYPTLSLKDARSAGEQLRKQVAKGLDPIETKKSEKEVVLTLKDLGERFLEKHCKENKKSWKEDERILGTYISTSKLSKLHPKDITRKNIKKLTDDIAKNNGKVMANRVFAFLNTMFKYAINEEELIEHSPCFGMPKPGGKEKKKTRYLKDEEIVIFWKGLDDSLITPPVINALKIILLTGQRPSEVCGINSNEINGHWWTIPGKRTKNGEDHTVYLTDFALKLIGTQKGSKFISPTSKKIITRFHLSQAISRKLESLPNEEHKAKHIPTDPTSRTYPRKWNLEKFTPHDLRRTCATHLVGLGFDQLLVGNILNHTDQSVTSIYNQYTYDKEKQVAMENWEQKILQLTDISKKKTPPKG